MRDWHAYALLMARVTLGLIFFMAGVYKVFSLGALEHARAYFLPYTDTFLPEWSLWDGRDDGGNTVASGIYFMKASTQIGSYVQKFVVVR